MANIFGRQVVLPLTNKSGGGVVAGDVVIVDTANDGAFTTTTAGQSQLSVGVAQETIANNASGRVLVAGYAALVNVPASVTRGHYVETHTVAKQATGNSTRRSGSFGQFLTGGTTPTAWLWGFPDNAGASGETVATAAIWDAAGDLAVGSGANTAAKLAIGNAGAVLARINGAVAWNAGTAFPTAATGDRYFRTDRGLEYYYDGTRWLTVTEYAAHLTVTDALVGTTTAPVLAAPVVQGANGCYATTLIAWTITTGTTSTNYVTYQLSSVVANNTLTSVGSSFNTQNDTSGNTVAKSVTINAVTDASAIRWRLAGTKTNSPTGLYCDAILHYRLIG